jgi:hypothetical protein
VLLVRPCRASPIEACLASLGSVLGTHRPAGVTMWARPRVAVGVMRTTDRLERQPNVHVEGQAPMTRLLSYQCKASGRKYATNRARGLPT